LVVTAERTPLYEEHVRLGAQMTNFSGWVMPLQYTSIREEHQAVRQAVGLFDLSHMGELRLTDAALAQRLVSRDLSKLRIGRAQYAMLCNADGGIIDDILIYAMADGSHLLVVNAGNQDSDFAWIQAQSSSPLVGEGRGGGSRDAVFNVGREWALLGVQGPRAVGLVQRLADQDVRALRYYAFTEGNVSGIAAIISRTGYTGEDGFEVFCANRDAPHLWQTLLEEGRSEGIRPAGLGARDTLRLEAGLRLYGNDMDSTTNPLEAGLEWTLSLETDFIGRDAILGARQRGLSRVLVGLRMLDRSIPRHGYPVLNERERVGVVTSGNVSFTLGYNIAMAYLPPALANEGTRLGVGVRGIAAPAEVVALPFYQRPRPK
jgi:aminomethyltransferase